MVNEDSSTNVYAWVSCLVFSFKLFFRVHEFHLSITISAFHAFRVFFSFLPLHVERYSSEKLWIIFPFSLSHIVVFGLYHLFTLSFFFLSMSDCSKRLTKCWFPSLKDSFFQHRQLFGTENDDWYARCRNPVMTVWIASSCWQKCEKIQWSWYFSFLWRVSHWNFTLRIGY